MGNESSLPYKNSLSCIKPHRTLSLQVSVLQPLFQPGCMRGDGRLHGCQTAGQETLLEPGFRIVYAETNLSLDLIKQML
jgi:hypothetical protein